MASVADIPHFALPFRFEPLNDTLTAAVNEQDSADDITACVEAVVRYRKGQRDVAPHFGIEDPVFHQGGVDSNALMQDIEDQEPRAQPALVAVEDELDRATSLEEGIDIVRISLGVIDLG